VTHTEGVPHDNNLAFVAGCTAIFTAGLSTALRAAVAGFMKTEFLDPIDPGRSGTLIGVALGAAFLGFSLMLLVTSTILDRIGMKNMLMMSATTFVVGTVTVMGAGAAGAATASYHVIVAGMLVTGLGWGAMEGTVNPLVAALYPLETTQHMNRLHAWWPAGLMVGGLAGVVAAKLGLDWRLILALVPISATVLGVLTLRSQFPLTTSAQLGVSGLDRFREALRRPSFFIWFVLMLFTAASELAPEQWVDVALTRVVGMRGVLLLVYVAAIQFIGRHFSGVLVRVLSAEGLLCVSCVLAAVGLFGLGFARDPAGALLATTAWGLGVCYLWPTMVAIVAQRYRRGGAFTVGLMGVAGSISSYFALPLLGTVYDQAKLEAAGGALALSTLRPGQLDAVLVYAASRSFQTVAIIPALLVIAFGFVWALARSKGKVGGGGAIAAKGV